MPTGNPAVAVLPGLPPSRGIPTGALALPRLEVPLDLARFVRARNALDQADHMLGCWPKRDHDGVVASTIEDQVAVARDSVAEAALVLLDA